jgi:hypothetical protein
VTLVPQSASQPVGAEDGAGACVFRAEAHTSQKLSSRVYACKLSYINLTALAAASRARQAVANVRDDLFIVKVGVRVSVLCWWVRCTLFGVTYYSLICQSEEQARKKNQPT